MGPAPVAVRRARFRHRLLRRPLVLWRHRDLTPSDALLAAYPRSGTTWLRFLLFETLSGTPAAFGRVRRGVPSVGDQHGAQALMPDGGRIVQTHEPYCDRDRRVVYIVRDARSVVVSEYAWQKRSRFFDGSLDSFVADFVAGRSNPWGRWDEHVDYWLDSIAAAHDHLLVVRYEDLRAGPETVFTDVLRFFGAQPSAAAVSEAIANNSLESMRAKQERARAPRDPAEKQRTTHVGTGAVGGWRHALAPAHVAAVEQHFGATLARLGYELSA